MQLLCQIYNRFLFRGNNSPHPPPYLTDLRYNHSSSAFKDPGGGVHVEAVLSRVKDHFPWEA